MEFIIGSSNIDNMYYMLNFVIDTYYILAKSKLPQSFENYFQLIDGTDAKNVLLV